MADQIAYGFSPTALDADGVCASQTLGGAGDLTINGALATAGVATFGEQQRVTLASAGNYSAVTFTLYGTDARGRSISEALVGPNNSTVTSTLNYKTVTRISSSAALGTAITSGNSDALETAWVALDTRRPIKSISIELSSGASMTFELQLSNQSPQRIITNESEIVAFADSTVTGKTASFLITATTAIQAARVKVTSFVSGTGTLRITEAGYC